MTLPGIISSQMMQAPDVEPFFGSDYILATDWDRAYSNSSIYDATANKTYIAWQTGSSVGSDRKGVRITSYNHSSGDWSDPVTVGNYTLADDAHGVPTLALDADGYIYCFFGTHNNSQKWSVSVSPNDITMWTQQADISGAYTYAHAESVGSALYLFLRKSTDLSRRPLVLRSGTPASGAVAFSAETSLVDLGADSRFYAGETHVRGTDIHIIAARANAADTARKGVYYFIYNTTNGSIRNFGGTTTITSGSLPVDLTTANSDFRIFDHGANDGDIPSLHFDSSGNPHILVTDGLTPTYSLKHFYHNGSAWTTPVTIATTADVSPLYGYSTTYSIVPSGSDMWAVYLSSDGDLKRRVFSGGTWLPQKNIARKLGYDLLPNSFTKNAHADIRFVYSEYRAWSSDADAEPLNLFAFGDSGGRLGSVSMVGADANWLDTFLLYGFHSGNNSTSAIDESPENYRAISFSGNARIDTSQSKFGGGSLRLDGTGDYVTVGASTAFDVDSGDFTFEWFVRLNELGRLQSFASKRTVGVSTSGWVFGMLSTNTLYFQMYNSGSAVINLLGSTALTTGVWYHVAATRSGSTVRVFLNGASEVSGTQSAAPSSTGSQNLLIGRDPTNTARDFNGWLDEIRITRMARYTSAFTPPAAAFPRR